MKNSLRRLSSFVLFSCATLILPVLAHTAFASGPTIITTELPYEIIGSYYDPTIEVADGAPPLTWSITSGDLPGGMSLDSSSGILSGSPYPSTAGVYHFTVQVIDGDSATDTQDFTLDVYNPLVITTTTTLPDATTTAFYSQTIHTTGGLAPYTWSAPEGLPTWLSLDSSTGILSGTPDMDNIWNVKVMVADSSGQSVSQTEVIIINPLPSLTTTSLGGGMVNTNYNEYLHPVGGTTPLMLSILSGSLPEGISLSGASLLGRPTTPGDYTFTVQVEDANGASTDKEFSLTVTYTPPVISSSLTDATAGSAYSKAIKLTGGLAPFTWSVLSGSLPDGFSLESSTGVISGSPISSGSSSFVIQVEDATSTTATQNLTLTIQPPPTITSTSLPDGSNNTPYSQTLHVTGGAAPFTWSIISGSLPSGMYLTASGVIGGRPTDTASTSFSVRVTGANETSTTQSLSLTINYASPTVATMTLPPSVDDGPTYYQTLEANGGTGPFVWTIIAGNLPSGITLNETTGVLSGATYPGTSDGLNAFTIQVTDANNESATREVSIMVYGPFDIVTTELPDAIQGVEYAEFVEVSGGIGPYTWQSMALIPTGLSLNTSTGEISGTPEETGTTNMLFWVTNAIGESLMGSVEVTVMAE